MKQRKPTRKSGNYVIRKPSGGQHGGAHGGEGWAVSYADLLMVLLSFFILFFSFEEPQPKQDPLPVKMANALEMSLEELLNLSEDTQIVAMTEDEFDALQAIAVPMPGKKIRKGLPKEASMEDLLADGEGDSEKPEDSALAGIAVPAPGNKVRKGLPREASMEDLLADKQSEGDAEKEVADAMAGISVPKPGFKAQKGIPIEASMEDLMADNLDPNASPEGADVSVPTPVRGVAVSNKQDPVTTENEAKLKEISKALNLYGVNVKVERSQLIVTMDNAAFEPASFELRPELRMRLNDVLLRLRPHFGFVQLTVVGHADRTKLLSKSNLLEDNFDLSSIRALRVLKYIVAKGFPENRASARASSFFDRDARSVTIVIQPAPDAGHKGSG